MVHLGIEDGLQHRRVRELPQKGECYHQRLLREETRGLLHFPLNISSKEGRKEGSSNVGNLLRVVDAQSVKHSVITERHLLCY
ncbi:hypothetical protein AAES_168868 [Amazona aestiva]|uniref:Uncharacterized protein n=1 Tax=Amazona aestiva TaxID=12930 RepID=A0A0Q3LS60_AMAAE|nr:hypothetical protein AAES_168868 [Amazona aestiva]